MKVLIVEDEKKVRAFIEQALDQAGMVVDTVGSAQDMLSALETSSYDVIVLDRLLDGVDALEDVGKIRDLAPDVKVLVLSALGDVDDKVKGLTEGADDYMGKPFNVSELTARIRALVRRKHKLGGPAKDTMIEYEDLKIDLERQRVFRGDARVDLTRKEFQVLTLLARRPGAVFSKSAILDQAWDMNHYPESNIVEVTIAGLRAKLDRGHRRLIQSRRGVGYWLGER
ncbi:MAG: response regulator transcription factor [bacterium]